MAILLTFFASIATIFGGVVTIRYKSKLRLILGFTAGVLLAVVAFDIVPEVVELTRQAGTDVHKAMIALVAGFLVFHILEKLLLLHHAQEDAYKEHKHPTIGMLSAIAFSAHSCMDGVGIGLAFKAARVTGILVAIAVISHDVSDGVNTASLMLLHKNSWRKALAFVLMDAAAPLVGVASTFFFNVPPGMLTLYLGFFSGFLLYIGASDILPQAHSEGPALGSIVMTLLGVVFIYLVTRVI